MTRVLRALGDETRLRIVALLSHGELCVCHIEAALDLSQPNASRHMGVLKAAGLVEPRREGNWIYYRLARQGDDAARRVLNTIVKAFASQQTLRRDVQKLLRTKGPLSCR
jgi:ArsR family transcriptional regulator